MYQTEIIIGLTLANVVTFVVCLSLAMRLKDIKGNLQVYANRIISTAFRADAEKNSPATNPAKIQAEVSPSTHYVADYEKIAKLAKILEDLAASHNRLDQESQAQANAIVQAINVDREEITRHRNLLGMFGDRFIVIERELMLLKGTLGSLHNPMTGAVPASLNSQFQQPANVPPPQPLPPAPVMTAQEMFARAVELEKAEMDKLDQAKAAISANLAATE